MKLASLLNHISVGAEFVGVKFGPPNILGPSLLGADFDRGRVCQGPSLLGAEMSRNRRVLCRPYELIACVEGYGIDWIEKSTVR